MSNHSYLYDYGEQPWVHGHLRKPPVAARRTGAQPPVCSTSPTNDDNRERPTPPLLPPMPSYPRIGDPTTPISQPPVLQQPRVCTEPPWGSCAPAGAVTQDNHRTPVSSQRTARSYTGSQPPPPSRAVPGSSAPPKSQTQVGTPVSVRSRPSFGELGGPQPAPPSRAVPGSSAYVPAQTAVDSPTTVRSRPSFGELGSPQPPPPSRAVPGSSAAVSAQTPVSSQTSVRSRPSFGELGGPQPPPPSRAVPGSSAARPYAELEAPTSPRFPSSTGSQPLAPSCAIPGSLASAKPQTPVKAPTLVRSHPELSSPTPSRFQQPVDPPVGPLPPLPSRAVSGSSALAKSPASTQSPKSVRFDIEVSSSTSQRFPPPIGLPRGPNATGGPSTPTSFNTPVELVAQHDPRTPVRSYTPTGAQTPTRSHNPVHSQVPRDRITPLPPGSPLGLDTPVILDPPVRMPSPLRIASPKVTAKPYDRNDEPMQYRKRHGKSRFVEENDDDDNENRKVNAYEAARLYTKSEGKKRVTTDDEPKDEPKAFHPGPNSELKSHFSDDSSTGSDHKKSIFGTAMFRDGRKKIEHLISHKLSMDMSDTRKTKEPAVDKNVKDSGDKSDGKSRIGQFLSHKKSKDLSDKSVKGSGDDNDGVKKIERFLLHKKSKNLRDVKSVESLADYQDGKKQVEHLLSRKKSKEMSDTKKAKEPVDSNDGKKKIEHFLSHNKSKDMADAKKGKEPAVNKKAQKPDANNKDLDQDDTIELMPRIRRAKSMPADSEVDGHADVSRPVPPRRKHTLSELYDLENMEPGALVRTPSGNMLTPEAAALREDRPASIRERQARIIASLKERRCLTYDEPERVAGETERVNDVPEPVVHEPERVNDEPERAIHEPEHAVVGDSTPTYRWSQLGNFVEITGPSDEVIRSAKDVEFNRQKRAKKKKKAKWLQPKYPPMVEEVNPATFLGCYCQ